MTAMIKLAGVALTLATHCAADLRMASQPRNAWQVVQRNDVKFVSKTVLYMEPSDFNYAGLKKQRDEGAYDNFLRSNIDNEQDKRDFNNEDGRDHLPFRSFEGSSTDLHSSVKTKIPAAAPGSNITATPGVPFLVPLRWNNPHSSELEVNVWIVQNKYVVPIRKPTCAGEGYADAVFDFTIPTDFNTIGSKVPGFAGCVNVGDCVLQIYAHSVEPRTYAIGTPLIVTGFDPVANKATATDASKISPVGVDPGLDLTKLRDLCLPSNDPTANIASAIPRMARYVSDVYNHAYQNSDYSPYSGQQPEGISKNLQASCILKMVSGNRGELGKAALKIDNPQASRAQGGLDNKVNKVIQQYESLANSFINLMGDKMKTNDTMGVNDTQKTEICFRCAEVGSTTRQRQTTTTYIPSFAVPSTQVEIIRMILPAAYAKLISDSGIIQIYVTALNDMNAEFVKAAALGLNYQPPFIKSTLTTMADPTNFKKIDASGKQDNGVYAARQAAKARAAVAFIQKANDTNLTAALASDSIVLPLSNVTAILQAEDMDAVMSDSSCDDDAKWDQTCSKPFVMFTYDASGNLITGLVSLSAPVAAAPWASAALAVALMFLRIP